MLNGQLAYPESGRPHWAALIVGAHPLLGAKPGNNIVDALRSSLAMNGAVTMSFSYRGTGASDSGNLDWQRMISDFWRDSHVAEESTWLEDGRSALEFLRTVVRSPIVLVGYSFGCWIVSCLHATRNAAAAVFISPNPTQHDLSGINAGGIPLLVISSDNDFSCPVEILRSWFDSLHNPKTHVLIPQGEHFFRGREAEVAEATNAQLAAWVIPRAMA